MSIAKTKKKNLGIQHKLDSFFILREAMKPVPLTKTLKRILFMEQTPFSNEPVFCYIINGKRAFTLQDIADLIKKNYTAVKKTLNKLKKKKRLNSEKLVLEVNEHYIEVRREEIPEGEYFSPSRKAGGRPVSLLFLHGVNILFGSMRGEYKDEMFYELNDYLFREMWEGRNRLYSPKPLLELPRMANKHYTTKNNDLVDSRGEIIIADILYDLGIPYQVGVYFPECGVNVDFVVKSEPLTIIEYWGYQNPKYEKSRTYKETVYREMGWNLISIEAEEVEEAAKLKLKLTDLFAIVDVNEKFVTKKKQAEVMEET